MEEKKQAPRSGKGVLVIVVFVILAAVIYGVVQSQSGKKSSGSGLKDPIELTVENLTGNWIRETEEIRYELLFEPGDHLIVAGYREGDKSPSIISIRGSYSISGDLISTEYTIDMEPYSEQYRAQISNEYMVLSPVGEAAGQLVGTYTRQTDDNAGTDAADTSSSDESADETSGGDDKTTLPEDSETAPPEEETTAETSASPETTSQPPVTTEAVTEAKQPPAFSTGKLSGSWMTFSPIYSYESSPSTDKVYYTLYFDSVGNVTYQAGFWVSTPTSLIFEPFEEKNFTYELEGFYLHFRSGGSESVYVVESIQEEILNLRYESGEALNSSYALTFYK